MMQVLNIAQEDQRDFQSIWISCVFCNWSNVIIEAPGAQDHFCHCANIPSTMTKMDQILQHLRPCRKLYTCLKNKQKSTRNIQRHLHILGRESDFRDMPLNWEHGDFLEEMHRDYLKSRTTSYTFSLSLSLPLSVVKGSVFFLFVFLLLLKFSKHSIECIKLEK